MHYLCSSSDLHRNTIAMKKKKPLKCEARGNMQLPRDTFDSTMRITGQHIFATSKSLNAWSCRKCNGHLSVFGLKVHNLLSSFPFSLFFFFRCYGSIAWVRALDGTGKQVPFHFISLPHPHMHGMKYKKRELSVLYRGNSPPPPPTGHIGFECP